MDTRTGEFIPPAELESFFRKMREDYPDPDEFEERANEIKEMKIPPTAHQLKAMKIGRNDPCPCGKDMKFKSVVGSRIEPEGGE